MPSSWTDSATYANNYCLFVIDINNGLAIGSKDQFVIPFTRSSNVYGDLNDLIK